MVRRTLHRKGQATPNEAASFLDDLISDGTALVLGSDLSGKSTLAKALYGDCKKRGLIPLLLEGNHLTSPHSERLTQELRAKFADQYAVDLWSAYGQLPAGRKVAIIDDFDDCKLNSKAQARLLEQLRLRFDVVVLFANDLFSIEELLKEQDEIKSADAPTIFNIREFGHLLRSKLIRRWVVLGREQEMAEAAITMEVAPLERLVMTVIGRSLLPSFPLLVLTILQSWESAKGTDVATGSYGYLYEMLILRALSTITLSQTQLDVVMTYLSRVAHEMLMQDRPSLPETEWRRMEDQYYEKFMMRLPVNIMDRLVGCARVLHADGSEFRFQYPYYYYFFVARYFRDNLGLEAGRSEVRQRLLQMAECIHYDDYANILSFFIYLTKDIDTIRVVLECSKQIYDEHSPCDLASDIDFVNKLYTSQSALVLPSIDHTKNRDDYRAELDRTEQDASTDEDLIGSERGERRKFDRSFSDIVKVNVATKMLQILGQVIRNSPGSLPAEVKKEVTLEAYSLGLRTLKALISIPADHLETLRTYIAELVREQRAVRKLPELLSSQLAQMADQGIIWITERYAIGIIRRISQAVGVDDLEEIYAEVLRVRPNSVPYLLIDLSIKLDRLQSAPKDEIQRLEKEFRKNFVAHNTLRELVFAYLYLAPVEYRSRQRLTKLMNIRIADSKLVDSVHKKRR